MENTMTDNIYKCKYLIYVNRYSKSVNNFKQINCK